jgi:Tfp pilus assembly protein PilF
LDKQEARALSYYIMAAFHEDLGNLSAAISDYQQCLKFEQDNPLLRLRLACGYIKNNQLEEAVKQLNECARLDAAVVEPHAILALIYSSQNKFELAGREYELALKNASRLEPGNVEIYKGLGLVYLRQKKFKEAEEAYKLAINLAPQDAEACFYLANIYDAQGRRPKAEEELKKSLELRPEYPEALNYLGYMYAEEGRNLPEAEGLIRRALEMDADNGAYIDSLGWLYFKQGKIAEALIELEKAAKLVEDPVVYEHLGDAYQKKGDCPQARANWEKSLKLNPEQDKIKKKLEGFLCSTTTPPR